MRHSLLHVNDKSDIMSMLSKEAKKETNKKEIKVDIPFEEWSNGESTDIYITKSRIVNDEFYKLLCNGNVYNNGIKSNEREGIIKFTYKNKNKIIYNPDYYIVNKNY